MRLTRALDALHLDGEVAVDGRWIKLRGEHCAVYVAELGTGKGFCAWCDHPAEREVEFFDDPHEAIRVGLERARRVG